MRNPDRTETVTYFIDGTNLCYWQDTTRPTLHVLLELLIALKKEKNRSFYCIFDANTQYKLPAEERETYQHLLEFKDHFYQITGGKRADDFILELANSYDAPVISNDTYSDPKYSKYSWKERDFTPKRLFMGEVIPLRGDIHLIIAELDLHVWLQDSVHNTFKRFVRTIQPASSRHRGKVKFFNRQEGWGLIAYETDIYFHRAALLESVDEGMEVEFVTGNNEKGICAEQIISGVNKREGKPLVAGVVETYDEIKTAGSIKVDETGEILFFYKSYIEDSVSVVLQKGMHVEFTVGTNKNGPCARNIRLAIIDEQKYLNEKIDQLETLVKERETQLKDRDAQVKEKENQIAQLKKQYEQNIQAANTARNAAEKNLRQLQNNLANNDNTKTTENGKQNAANGQMVVNNNGTNNKNQANNNNTNNNGNNKNQQNNNGNPNNSNPNNENTDNNDNKNDHAKENLNGNPNITPPKPTQKENPDKHQPAAHKKHNDKLREQNPNHKNDKHQTQQPDKQSTNNKPINTVEQTETIAKNTNLVNPETVQQDLSIQVQNAIIETTNIETTSENTNNQNNTNPATENPLLPLDIDPKIATNTPIDKNKKSQKGKKEQPKSKEQPKLIETTPEPIVTTNTEKPNPKTPKETPHKTKTTTEKTTQNQDTPINDANNNTENNNPNNNQNEPNNDNNTTEITPAIKQIITADYFDTPIKRKQWWASLQPQWKKAFNVWVGKGEITDVPDDEHLQQIFSTEKLSFKLSKHKLSFQLTNLSGLQYLSNLSSLNISDQAISDLKGTEKLHKLTHFNGSKNKLSSLEGIDLLINIEELICSSNQLTANAFDNIATRLPRLRSLDCKHNQLTKEEANQLKKNSNIKDLKI